MFRKKKDPDNAIQFLEKALGHYNEINQPLYVKETEKEIDLARDGQ